MRKRTNNQRGEVVDLIRRILPEEKEFAAELESQINRRQLVGQLATLRNAKGISQEDVAEQLNCTQSRISKLENGFDEDVTVGDLAAYAKLADSDVTVLFDSKNDTLATQVKFYAMRIKDCLDQMNDLVKEDLLISKGVAKFHLEALFNLVSIVGEANEELNNCRPSRPSIEPRIRLRIQDLDLSSNLPRLFPCSKSEETAIS